MSATVTNEFLVGAPDTPDLQYTEFLRRRLPLTLAAFDKSAEKAARGMVCRVFADLDEAVAWARERNAAGLHLYVVNNAPPDGWTPKNGNPPTEVDITHRARLQIDLDPTGEDHEAARTHALHVLDLMPIPPTTIVDSGRGIQAHWELVRPTDDLFSAKAVNEKLIDWLREASDTSLIKCDGVANANRLMRLPGYINHKTGRAATILTHVEGRCCSLEQMEEMVGRTELVRPATVERFHADFDDKVRNAAVGPLQRDLLAELAALEMSDLATDPNLDDLPTDIAKMQARYCVRSKDDLALGDDGLPYRIPLEEAGYTESEAVLAFAGECVRDGAALDVALSFLVSAGWPIGGHARRQKNPLRAARRALAEAIISNELSARFVGNDGAPPFSQEHLALTFAELHAENLRYVAEWGQWYVWKGNRWHKDKTLDVFDHVRRLAREAASKVEKPSAAHELCRASSTAAIERLARSDRRLAMPAEGWDADPYLLNTPDGMVRLDTGEMLAHAPAAYCTKLTGVGPAAPGTEPRRWLRFLSEVTDGDAEYVAYLQRMCGYFLTGATTEHALFFAWGTGRNGKSVFANTIRWIMGDYATSTATDTLTVNAQPQHPTELADLRGARLVTVQETEDGRRWAEARIKQMTGGDPIKARFMRQDFFEYQPQFKLLIAGNHRPGLGTVDEAIRRRIHLLPFTVTIPEEQVDRHLEEALRAEVAAILRWMIDGCALWRAEGLERPARVKAATQEYLQDEDMMGRWIAESCERAPTHKELVADLFDSYLAWCAAANERAVSKKKFSMTLRDRGERPDDTGGKRGFVGLRLTAEARRAALARRGWPEPTPF